MLDIIIADLTNPRLWLVMLIWVAIGVMNKLVYYEAGERTGEAALEKVHGYTAERAAQFNHLYDRWGVPLLLLSSVPVVGAAITVLAGVDKVSKLLFVILVAISNLVRNWLIIFLSGGVVALLE